MLSIGLTGGIGSGKSTVAKLFGELGVEIIDSDIIAHSVVQSGSDALKKIVAHFGPDILQPDQQLDRKKLATKIFENPEEKIWLEALLHPLIIEEIRSEITHVQSPYCIVVIPLLVETLPHPMIDRILVIDAPQEEQIRRTQQRDQRSTEEIQAIISTQASAEDRLAVADDLIINDKGLDELREAVSKLHQYYLKLTTI